MAAAQQLVREVWQWDPNLALACPEARLRLGKVWPQAQMQ